MSELREPDLSQYLIDRDLPYIETDNEITHIETHLEAGENLIQRGPQGVGKTLSFSYVGAEKEIPVVQFDCSQDTSEADFVARPWLEVDENGEKKTVYIPGVMPIAIMAANEYDQAMLILEEVNSLSPSGQKMLNQVADWRESIKIPGADETVALDEDAQLMVGATMNPSGFGGTFDLNDDLRSRFNELHRPFPKTRILKQVMEANGCPERVGSEHDIIDRIVSLVESLHSLSVNRKISYPLSPRDAVRLGKMWREYYHRVNNENKALKLALETSVVGKYSDKDEREIVTDEIGKSLGVKVS